MYSNVDSGAKLYRSRKQIGGTHDTDIDFGDVVPVVARFVLPGDVLKISARLFVRYQPTLAPILNRCNIRIRYFFVNLRQVEPSIETIITGSKDGRSVAEVPVCDNFVAYVNDDANYVVSKHKFWDYMHVDCLNYKSIKNDKCLPALYWYKAYMKIYWDYYRDENLSDTDYEDFEDYWDNALKMLGGQADLFSASLPKDYFTSSTPFELKGEVPTFDVEVSSPFSENSLIYNYGLMNESVPAYGDNANLLVDLEPSSDGNWIPRAVPNDKIYISPGSSAYGPEGEYDKPKPFLIGVRGSSLNNVWNGFSGSFNARDVRRMFALTRIEERNMRCGSRYTEYLRANFHTSPADETLQRPVYLGGFKQPIVTNEVLQQAEDGSTPVGTMRGKGISDGGSTLKPYVAKEFGLLFGLVDVLPDVIYSSGIDRQLTYKSRFDFFNPSFQNLSEQEVRNGELYISTSDGKNDDTFGFQGMYNELRSRRNICTGDMRDGLKYWTQSIEFASRPNLNGAFISSASYKTNFKRPFSVVGSNPILLHVDNMIDAYRPMVSEPTPGLVDHN